jgi:hypothetical protein
MGPAYVRAGIYGIEIVVFDFRKEKLHSWSIFYWFRSSLADLLN